MVCAIAFICGVEQLSKHLRGMGGCLWKIVLTSEDTC